MAKVSPIQFFRQVKQEVKKVTWPTRKDAATFFFFVDQIIGWLMKLILGLGV